MDITVDNVFPDGPSSNPTPPSKALIRSYFRQFETAVDAGLSNGGLIYDTKANMDADLAHDANSSAWVIADSTVANNGIYQKQGASGTGSWTRIADLPYSFISASNAGAGTANAIQATTSIPIPAGDLAAKINLNITANNTGPATVAFNGGSALPIKTNSGADVQADYLVEGGYIEGFIVGGTFRLTTDVGTAADRAAAEAAAQEAVEAAANANGVTPVADKTAAAALNTSNKKVLWLLEEGQKGDYSLVDNTSGDYDDDLTDDVNGGFVIASDTAPYIWNRRPDWYLDGEHFKLGATSDDTDALQGFFNIAARRSKQAFMPPTSVYGSGQIDVPDKLRLFGIRGESALYAHASLPVGTSLLVGDLLSDIQIKDIVIDGNSANRLSAGKKDASIALVRLTGTTNLRMSGVHLRNQGYIMLNIGGAEQAIIEACEFSGWGKETSTAEGGAAIWWGDRSGTWGDGITITRCNFHDAEWSGLYLYGRNAKIIANTFETLKEGPIYTRCNDTGDFKDFIIADNFIDGVVKKYISAEGMEIGGVNGLIARNIIQNIGAQAITLTDVSERIDVASNRITSAVQNTTDYASAAAIEIDSTGISTHKPNNINIIGNVIRDPNALTPYGIKVLEYGSEALTNIAIVDNDLRGSAYAAGVDTPSRYINYGPFAAAGTGWLIRGNKGHASERPVKKTGSFAASTGSVSITGVGFKPSRVELHCRVTGTADTRCEGSINRDGVGASVQYGHSSSAGYQSGSATGSIAKLVNGTGTIVFEASFTSFDYDGCTFNVTTGATNPNYVATFYP